MSKLAVVYWSGTGNTEAMANFVADGARGAGAEVEVISASNFTPSMISSYDGFAFGCPSMGAEQLESSEFEPMWESVKDGLNGKKVTLFGSYDWGVGEWMETWKASASGDVLGTVICNREPDAQAEADCRLLGEKLAN
ncbi:MAG: flavodoxin domain-containing protein [Anaerorhabdus sp.]